MLARLAQRILHCFLQFGLRFFGAMPLLLQPGAERLDGGGCSGDGFVQRGTQNLRSRGGVLLRLNRSGARGFSERGLQRLRAGGRILLGLRKRHLRDFGQFTAQFLGRVGQRCFEFGIPLLRRGGSVALRLFDGFTAHRLRGFLEILAPLFQMILGGLGRG